MPLYPIGFSIPESKIVKEIPEKTKKLATIVPGDTSTYIFNDEEGYRKDYQISIFGYTWKKGGWDCLRHYEILANGCIPWFKDLEQCPKDTLTFFPKDIVKKAMEAETPEEYIPQLLDYTRNHLSCRAMAQSIFNIVGCPTPKRVLFLSSDPNPDYLRCLTLIGMKQILGKECVDSIHIPHIYEDYSTPNKLYGNGFHYTRILPASFKSPPLLMSELQNGSFDLIVYGSIHRGLPFWNEVTNVYPRDKIVMICGEDCDCPHRQYHTCWGKSMAEKGFPVFIREQSS